MTSKLEELPNLLRDLRIEKRISFRKLSTIAGHPHNTMAKFLAGRMITTPKIGMMVDIARALGYEIEINLVKKEK